MDPIVKKQALRSFTYGLYVVMCKDDDIVNAFTANWLTQVSFEPPLLALSIENDAKSLAMIQHSQTFTINVLQSGQKELAGKLGKSYLKHPDKLTGVPYILQQNNYPILQAALSWVACKVQNTVPAGDSTLIIAEVINAGILTEGDSLTMKEAGFRHAG
ncbi:flavin reductase family protein [Dictyobacter arantiisoli]|uniref:Flavin reductase n=1 Tax=Dictyobacter arantiisoli TaxID=2014874 RepID=A0A5A5TK81_9CHLR|nr:flavin reductase family protein [Dictyobacter arantiisoli]GCF11486.1 flavin reductase [Dictyobacter arantiisoli]